MTVYINLLPSAVRRRQVLMLRIRQWTCIWLLGMTLAGIYAWGSYRSFSYSQQQLVMRQTQCKPIEQLEADAKLREGEIAALRNREQLALAIANDRPLVQLVGLISHVAKKVGGVVVDHFEISSTNFAGDPQRRTLSMQGLGTTGEAVTEFLKQLRDSKMFVRIDLHSTENSAENQRLRQYSIVGDF